MDKKEFAVKLEVVDGAYIYKPTADQARVVVRILDDLHSFLKMYKQHGHKRCANCKVWNEDHKKQNGGFECKASADKNEIWISDKVLIVILEHGEKVYFPLQTAKAGVDYLLEHWAEFCITMRAEVGATREVIYRVRTNGATSAELQQIEKLMGRYVSQGVASKEEN